MAWYDVQRDAPAFCFALFIPVAIVVLLPVILIRMLRRLRWVNNMRDGSIAIFTGLLSVYFILTIIGAGFRGAGQDLVLPWDVPHID